eukprot:s901_g11.t1
MRNQDAEGRGSYELGSPQVAGGEERGISLLEGPESPAEPPPVRILLLAFMIMFQGYGVMNGNPAHALKMKLDLPPSEAAAFQDATASFQLSKLLMRILQISLLVFLQPNGIVYLAYAIMFVALLIPIIFVWGEDMKDLSVVYLQYTLGGIAVGLFEGTFLSVISVLGKRTKTFAIMGAPLGFAVHNILLGSVLPAGYEVVYYVYSAACIPIAVVIFYFYAPLADANSQGKGCQIFLESLQQPKQWLPAMLPWFLAKFAGNFVMEDAFPLLYLTFNTPHVPLFAPSSTSPTVPFKYYTAFYYFVLMALGDTISRRVPEVLNLSTGKAWGFWIVISILLCIGGEALNFLLIPIITGFAAFIAYFGNGLVYGLSAQFIDAYIPAEHRYTAYNLWCFAGDLAGYAGQGGLSVKIAEVAHQAQLKKTKVQNLLKHLFEANEVLKVVHRCPMVSDVLNHQLGIWLNNVFDTAIAWELLDDSEKPRKPSVSQVLAKYSKMKGSLPEKKGSLEATKEKPKPAQRAEMALFDLMGMASGPAPSENREDKEVMLLELQGLLDMFVHRIQGIKDKLHGFEEFVQAQLDDPRADRGRRDSRDSEMSVRVSMTRQSTEDLGNKARERSGTVEDMKQLQEPVALTEHREKKWESTAGWYWPLGTVSSLTQTSNFLGSGKELRLHNRWMQLSMQAEALLALSERTQSSFANKYAPHNTSGLSEALDNSGVGVFHPLGKVRVVWDLCGLALLLADAILLPLSLAWDWHQGTDEPGSLFLLVVFLLSLLFWSMDICMNLNTAFYQRGFLVFSRWEILKHYLQTWFIIDVAVVTLDYVTLGNYIADAERSSLGQLMRSMRVVRAFRLVRLLKMARFDDLMQEIAASTGRQWIMLVVAIINSAVAILLVAHVMTCFWYFVGRQVENEGRQSWLSLEGANDKDPFTQYLHAFRYIMDAPSPPVITPDSVTERFFDILLSIFCLVVIGSAISKISGTMVELRSMNEAFDRNGRWQSGFHRPKQEAKSKQRYEIRQYLHSQDASFELVSRVMKFVEYKLEPGAGYSANLARSFSFQEKMMPTTFDSSLISHTLQTELSVNQRSRFIETVPVFALTQTLYPEVCVVLKKVVCENQEEVFVAGALSTSMYITVTGEYSHVQGYDLTVDPKILTGVNRLEELALYVDALAHHSSLFATTFAEMFTLDGDNLVACLQNSPSCAAMFFEPPVRAPRGTQETRLDNIDLSNLPAERAFISEGTALGSTNSRSFFGDHDFFGDASNSMAEVAQEKPLKGLEMEHSGNLQWMIEEGWKRDLQVNTLPAQLQECLPELRPNNGPHAIFEQPLERDRAESSCICTLALIHNRYDIFTMPQPPSAKLLEKQWQILQTIITWVEPTYDTCLNLSFKMSGRFSSQGQLSFRRREEKIHAVLVLLAIRSLGKSKAVANQCPQNDRSPENVVLHLIEEYQNVVPSVQGLNAAGMKYAKGALHLHSMFNLAQMLQGENVPANVSQLQESIKRDGVEALRFYILFLLGFMSGLNAGRGSKFLTAKRAESFIEGVRILKYLLDASPCGIYWGYLSSRAHSLGVPCQTAEELVLIRLACLARVEDRSAYRQLEEHRQLLRLVSQRHDDRYWLFRSPANASGHYGIIIGFQRALPIGQIVKKGCPARDIYISEHEVSVIDAQPRSLILRLTNPLIKCIVIAGHAPHTGSGEANILSWWADLSQAIPHAFRSWDIILLTDANARIGSEPCDSIGSHQAEGLDPRAEGFTNFIRQHNLWVPATFEDCHCGSGETWRHSRGQWYRNDYICLPRSWHLETCTSWISDDIDASLAKEDHRPAVVHCRRHLVPYPSVHRHKVTKLHFDQIDSSVLSHLPRPPWNCDVHTHCHLLQDSIVAALRPQRKVKQRGPLRQTMSESTWQIVKEKRASRNLLAHRAQVQRQTLLSAWFACWKHAIHECPFHHLANAFDDLLCEQDRLIALAYHAFRRLGYVVTRALKHDDVLFYSSLLADCAEFLHPSQAKNLWQIVRRSLPKYQQRRLSMKPSLFAQLEDQWVPHYCELEAGTPIGPAQLLEDCVMSQARNSLDAPLQIELRDLPSLTHLEKTFRSTSAGKSTGHDVLPSALFHTAAKELALLHHDLVLKSYLWQSEPIQAKGGPVALIPKVLHPATAKQFRGILLLPSAGKRAHAILRNQIMTVLWPARSQGQMGGFPAQQVLFGSHAMRTFGALCDQHGLSSAILFLDLSSAFHHLIREVVVGAVDGYNLAPVLDVLSQSQHPVASFSQFEKLPGLLEELGVPVAIVRLLRDMHFSTWCALHDRWLLRTHRGTRPGSPLADIIFHTLMARVAHSLDQWLRDQHDFQVLLQDIGIEAPSVIWADDIAVPLAAACAEQIVPFLQQALQTARDALQQYGFSLNLAKGKTSAVLSFCGPRASAMRKQYQLHAHSGITCHFSDGQEVWLHLVPVYRHLGTLFSSSHDIMCELRARVGIAKAAFAQLSRPLLTNRNLPVRIRLQMFHALVTSKLFFGLGAWVTPNPKQLQYIQSALVNMLKRVLRLHHDHIPAEQVFCLAGTADVRSRLALDRLLYAFRLFRSGPVFVQNLVQREFEQTTGSWLHGLRADLQWLDTVSPNSLPSGWQDDMSPLFEQWQDPQCSWPSLVKRTWRKHLLQNGIMSDAHLLHTAVFRGLRQAGATFSPSASDWEGDLEQFECFCSKKFASRRGLLAHQRKAHAIFSVERQFLQGCTCMHCGKYLWTTQRLQQHLAYIPRKLGYNPCFQALKEQERQVPYDRAGHEFVNQFAGLARREALVTQGPPCDPTPAVDRRFAALHSEIEACRSSLQVPFQPADPLGFGAKIGDLLSAVTLRWFENHVSHDVTSQIRAQLIDEWIEVLYAGGQESEDDLDPWLEFVFLTWGEHWLPDLLDSLEDGVFAREIDEAFADFASQLDRYQTLARIAHLDHALRTCQRAEPAPHRDAYVLGVLRHPKTSSKVRQAVPRAFAEQSEWQADVRNMRFLDLPPDQPIPKLKLPDGREVFLIVHLFSGRRRENDVHHHLHDLARNHGLSILVLSLDTAVTLEYGNLALHSPSWRCLQQVYQAGVVAATVTGSPCETFSEARYMAPPEGSEVRSWPRPLRSAERLFGLENLTMRELRQCHMGGNFFQQGALALSFHMARGGVFISEHPAKPSDEQRPSIWSSALLSVLLQHPDAKLSTVPQFLWGATAVKPTGLLHFRLPYFCRDLFSQADPCAVRPHEAAIGRDGNGCFRTAKHKEYPDRFCRGIATALVKALVHAERSGTTRVVEPDSFPLTRWIQEAEQA